MNTYGPKSIRAYPGSVSTIAKDRNTHILNSFPNYPGGGTGLCFFFLSLILICLTR